MSLKEFAADAGTVIESPAEAGEDQFMVLDLNLIVASSHNPRTVFNLPRLQELAESIKAGGVRQPILVRPLPPHRMQETFEGFKRGQRPAYELIAGERRFRASKIAGVDTIPAIIRHLSDEQVLKDQLVENLQRDDLHAMEEAEGYERLIQATGISKDQIGEEIGKSRAYVYARLKLLDLCQEARKAFYEGEIDASRALVIARIPVEKLQAKALAEATAKDWHGGPRHNFKNFALWAQQNLMLRLDAARFKITDESLVPDAGSCRDCVKRTGAQPEVYADIESADVCTDPVCYHNKDAAHEVTVIELAKAKGQQVILEKEAKAIWQHEHVPLKGFTRLDRPDPRAHDTKALKTVLAKNMPQPILMQNPHKKGELIEVLPTPQVTKLLKDMGKIAPKASTPAQKKQVEEPPRPVEERREYHNRWQETVLARADDKFRAWKAAVPAPVLRAFMIYMLEVADEGAFGPALDLGTEFDTADALKRLNTLPDSAMPGTFLRYVMHETEAGFPSPWTHEQRSKTEPKHPTWEILSLAEIDVDAIQLEVKEDMESADRAKAAASDEAKTPNSPKAKKSTAPPAAQALRARKPTAEEVQMDIADALQELEAQKNSQDQAPDGARQEEESQAPTGANEEEGAAPAAPAPTFSIGQLVKVRAGSKGPGGKFLKSIGRVGRVIGLGDDGRVHIKHGERKHELVIVEAEQLDPYAALPSIGDQVRILRTGIAPGQDKLLWRTGIVETCEQDGWGVRFPASGTDGEAFTYFETDSLEVLA
ncbi:ParB/RepB/Spo0J family partition protein [Variovorax sp. 375MFSha3.1]|uniref:ParB/RepB/Spo0J family partition protein n=1 Tax=Variovorax sp. 375MFSha3.1 TaxID=3158364 RepID=UPI003AABEE16